MTANTCTGMHARATAISVYPVWSTVVFGFWISWVEPLPRGWNFQPLFLFILVRRLVARYICLSEKSISSSAVLSSLRIFNEGRPLDATLITIFVDNADGDARDLAHMILSNMITAFSLAYQVQS